MDAEIAESSGPSLVDEVAIREHLARFLAGDLTLDEFEDWFTPATWDPNRLTMDARRLASEIELRLAEFSSGHWSREDLNERLHRVLARVDVFTGSVRVATGSSASVVRSPVSYRTLVGAGTRSVEAPA